MKSVRKLIRNGNSTMVVLEGKLLEFLRWRAGDYVVVELADDGTLSVRPATTVDMRAPAPKRAAAALPFEATR